MKGQWNWKRIAGMGSGIVVLVTLLVIVAFLLLDGATNTKPATPEKGSPPSSDAALPDEAPEKGQAAAASWEPAAFDESGLVEMVVTTSAEEAALSAARVLWSVDASKQRYHEDFVRAALTRVMRPSPAYVGAEGTIRTTIDRSKSNLGHTEWVTGDLVQTTIDELRASKWNPRGGWWWELGDEVRYNALTGHGISYVSHPIEAFGTGMPIADDLGVTTEIEANWEADALPGKYSKHWVRVESAIDSGGESGTGVQRVRNATAMLIYCDPPANGGICGVAALTKSYPTQWQRQQ